VFFISSSRQNTRSKRDWSSDVCSDLVNYSGSSGYGRRYRDRLYGNWGLLDVADCASGAQYLAEQQRVDGARMAVRGGSAGGFTTLAALTFTDTFAAGASYYGIGDLEALAAH